MSNVIETVGLSYITGGTVVLQDINVTVGENEVVTVIGPNGAGKTSLAKLILNLLKPTSGTIIRRPALRMGYVPQNFAVERYLPVTVKTFLRSATSGALVRSQPNNKQIAARNWFGRRSIIDDGVINLTDTAHLMNRPLHMLSGGELRRVLTARALLAKPELLVMDEPVSGFDLHQKDRFYHMLKDAREELKCAMIIVSHDLMMIMNSTDKVICINKTLCCADSPVAVSKHPAFTGLFSSGLKNIAIYDHQHLHREDA